MQERSSQDFFGWPVVTAENCFETIRRHGIRPWPTTQDPEPLDRYLQAASSEQMVEYQRFGPQNFVARHENPSTGEGFNGFRSVFKPCSMVFAVVDGLVLVTAEWKHGNNRITIVPVAGMPGKDEADLPLHEKMRRTALREWEEETGTKLVSVEALGPEEGVWSVVRQTESHCFPYLGTVATPIQKGPTKLDQNEKLIMVAFPLSEWVKLIESPELWDEHREFGLEVCSRDITYAALRKLGKLKLTV